MDDIEIEPSTQRKAPVSGKAVLGPVVLGEVMLEPDVLGEAVEGLTAATNSMVNVACVDEVQKRKRAYEMKRHFQDNWAARFPCAEPVQNVTGDITQVRCAICTRIQFRDKLLVSKIDGSWKHAGRRRAPRDMVVNRKSVKAVNFYFISTNGHEKNEKLFAGQLQHQLVRQMDRQSSEEKKKKLVQLKLLDHLLTLGRPMTDYEASRDLFIAVDVPQLPKKHWSDSSGWEMAVSLCHIVAKKCR